MVWNELSCPCSLETPSPNVSLFFGASPSEIRFGQRGQGANKRTETVILSRQHLPFGLLLFFNENILHTLQLSSLPLPGSFEKMFVLHLSSLPLHLPGHNLMNTFNYTSCFLTPSDKLYQLKDSFSELVFVFVFVFITIHFLVQREEVEGIYLSVLTGQAEYLFCYLLTSWPWRNSTCFWTLVFLTGKWREIISVFILRIKMNILGTSHPDKIV